MATKRSTKPAPCRGYSEGRVEKRTRRYDDGSTEVETTVGTTVKKCPGDAPKKAPEPKPSPKPNPSPKSDPIVYNDPYDGAFEDRFNVEDPSEADVVIADCSVDPLSPCVPIEPLSLPGIGDSVESFDCFV